MYILGMVVIVVLFLKVMKYLVSKCGMVIDHVDNVWLSMCLGCSLDNSFKLFIWHNSRLQFAWDWRGKRRGVYFIIVTFILLIHNLGTVG